jgi:hypothetical protein
LIGRVALPELSLTIALLLLIGRDEPLKLSLTMAFELLLIRWLDGVCPLVPIIAPEMYASGQLFAELYVTFLIIDCSPHPFILLTLPNRSWELALLITIDALLLSKLRFDEHSFDEVNIIKALANKRNLTARHIFL